MSIFKHRPIVFPSIILGLILVISACTPFQSLEYKGLTDWKIKPKSLAESKLSATIQVYNPNKYKIAVKRIEADIEVNGGKWSRFELDSVFYVPPQSDFSFPIKLTVKNSDLLSGGMKLLNSGTLPYTLIGKIKGTYRGITADVPFAQNGIFSEGDLKF